MLKNMMECLTQRSPEYINVMVQSFFLGGGGGGGGGGGKFINCTLIPYQTDSLYFSMMILKALQLMGL